MHGQLSDTGPSNEPRTQSTRVAQLFRRLWFGQTMQPGTYLISSTLFLRLLGLVYLIAFVSLWTQLDGLIGQAGILPASDFLEDVEHFYADQEPSESAAWNVPTLAWLNSSDWSLHAICAVGTLMSGFVIIGALPLPSLVGLWVCYLSMFHVGQVFLGFQWDILLMEVGFLAIFVAPFSWRSRLFGDQHPPRLAIWLIWWLLFRLMFESGVVKLTWNDVGEGRIPIENAWESLTAMQYHYWTQPLPMWTSWFADKFPTWFSKLSVTGVLIIELVIPWFIFGPRVLRNFAAASIAFLMLAIALTGNYNFFNLLTVVMTITLLDDRCWPAWFKRRFEFRTDAVVSIFRRKSAIVLVPFAVFVILIGGLQVKRAVWPPTDRRLPLEYRWNVAQFHWANSYGLFRRMTETRPEIVIEGSADGRNWQEYEFRWKPGDLSRRPGLVAPHQPRLDWQMWFEALRFEQVYDNLGDIPLRHVSPWFASFLVALSENRSDVVDLLSRNPFEETPAKYLRIRMYQYRFATADEGRQSGDWWRRREVWTGTPWATGNR